jgi:hypothetical protein
VKIFNVSRFLLGRLALMASLWDGSRLKNKTNEMI